MFIRVFLLASIAAPVAAQVPPADSAWLVATTQSLLDAVTSGDTAIWAPQLAPDWFQATEEGEIVDRAEFLAGLRALPRGQKGKSHPHPPSSHRQLRRGRAQLRRGRVARLLRPGAANGLPHHRHLDSLRRTMAAARVAGHGPAPPDSGRTCAPAARTRVCGSLCPHLGNPPDDRGHRFRSRDDPAGWLEPAVHALDDRLFVRHGVRGFWLFERDSSGRVTGLVNWRDNNPVAWRRER
jgi:hypothetical protein